MTTRRTLIRGKNALCFFLPIVFYSTYAQTTTLLTYDANGNRVRKQVVGSSPHPTVTVSPEAVFPLQPATLVASGCPGTVRWLPDNQTTTQITVSPSATTQYTALCSVSGCANSGSTKATVTVIECPTVELSTASSAPTARYGQLVTLYAYGCNTGQVVWSSGQIGSTINAPIYNTATPFTATCRTEYCTSLGTSTVLVGGISGCAMGDVIVSRQPGNWNDANTWFCGRLPTRNDEVVLNHPVTVHGTIGYAKSIIKGDGYLVISGTGTIITSP